MLHNSLYTCIQYIYFLLIFDNKFDIQIKQTLLKQRMRIKHDNRLSYSRHTTDGCFFPWYTGFNSRSPDSVPCGRSIIHCTVCCHSSVPITVSNIWYLF